MSSVPTVPTLFSKSPFLPARAASRGHATRSRRLTQHGTLVRSLASAVCRVVVRSVAVGAGHDCGGLSHVAGLVLRRRRYFHGSYTGGTSFNLPTTAGEWIALSTSTCETSPSACDRHVNANYACGWEQRLTIVTERGCNRTARGGRYPSGRTVPSCSVQP